VPFGECADTARYVPNQTASVNSGTLIHPEPRRGVYRSKSLGIIVPSAAELWSHLHLEQATGKTQSSGRYSRRHALTQRDLEHHLAGDITLALSVLSGQRALFAVLDVDALFPQLLPAIRTAVGAIGSEALSAAIFCTGGSDAGRGKVIVTFTEPVPASDARKLARRLCDRVRASEAAQSLERHHLSAYPQEKSGGVVRVLGRNAARDGSIEAAFSLDGELGLSHVRALTAQGLAEIVAAIPAKIAPWAKRRIETPWLRLEGTQKHYRWIVALAREAIRVFGGASGRQQFDEWLDRIKANSPELSLPSDKTKDPRNVLDHARGRAWEYASRRPNSWEPLDLRMRTGIPRGVVRAYGALVSYARDKGLRPEHFAVDYERIGRLTGAPKTTAFRWVQRAVEYGVLVIHERGTRHTKGLSGKCTALGIVCRGQTQEQVRAAGAQNERARRLKAAPSRSRRSTSCVPPVS
jgi:hypothetical protein